MAPTAKPTKPSHLPQLAPVKAPFATAAKVPAPLTAPAPHFLQ